MHFCDVLLRFDARGHIVSKLVLSDVTAPDRSKPLNLYQLCGYNVNLQAILFSKWYSLFIYVCINPL